MKLYTLMEDGALSPAFACEHGLSFYIETGGRRLLFDMGQTELYLQNAKTLGVSLAAVDLAVVSHGHYDHGGGLAAFLRENDHAPVYVHEKAFEPHFSEKKDGIHAIGLDTALQQSSRLVRTRGVTRIDDTLTLFADVTGENCPPCGNRTLYEREGDAYVPDRFVHEQSLLVREGDRHVLFTGCAHRGVVNILARARALAGRDPDVVIGGMHLYSPGTGRTDPVENVRAVGERLAQSAARFYTCHCTGPDAFRLLREQLGARIDYLSAGSVLEL